MSSQPETAAPTSSTGSSSTRPKVNLSPTAHLDPNAYIRGTHPITIGANTLVHPRAHLLSVYCPLIIGENCIISERALLGGPLPPSSSSASTNISNTTTSPSIDKDQTVTPTITTISSNVYIQPYAQISHSATLQTYSLIESHSTIASGVTVGEHSKICSSVVVDRDVPEWTVVYGDGSLRRSRRTTSKPTPSHEEGGGQESSDHDDDIVEAARLKAMDKERHADLSLLRNAARMASAARKK